MSEAGVGVVARAALDRARERFAVRRREYYRQLVDIAALAELGVAGQTGDRVTHRLLQELWPPRPG
ncbi:hypothetical protein [Actinomycetospora cinnamomea]|uniref:Uncharacterized protein n=1 Tax=Actinomycetospora cinnamomea TaxID=663609 RepID=A0A2U1EBE9_9PSEU|nr:hypothetical protein [Actinomycetospora cinnamomea]PVY97271.1 hypothetical protein C8D89_12513 [Actinomycetospora cinnamomea]